MELGMKSLGPWMLSWPEEFGNRGIAMTDDTMCLVELILARGLLAEGAELAGVAKIAATTVNANLLPQQYEMPLLKVGLVPVGVVGYVKGWTRCAALLFFIDAVFRLGLLHDFKSDPVA